MLENTMKYTGILMVMLYLAIGISVLLNYGGLYGIPEKYSLPLGTLLILYAFFRGYKLYQKHFKKDL